MELPLPQILRWSVQLPALKNWFINFVLCQSVDLRQPYIFSLCVFSEIINVEKRAKEA